jgi:DNA-binding response OmpR family regulator
MNSAKILVVDDDPSVLLLIEFNLKQRGYSVETATDAPSALHKALEGDFDLLILDVMLPGFSGFQLCERLRRERRFLDTPILLVTARSQVEDFEEAAKVGATDYITKPFDPAALVRQVGEYLDSKGTSA